MSTFRILDPRYVLEDLGLIPLFLSELDPRPAAKQFQANYAHGGGWHPTPGWKAGPAGEIMYPGDPALNPIAIATLHNNEIIRVYPHAWVSITQPDGEFEVARLD